MTQFKVNYAFEIVLLLLKKEWYGRELAKELRTSLTRAQSVLAELYSSNVVDFKKEGRNHIYFLKKNMMARSYVLSAEHYKLAKLLSKYRLEPVIRDIVTKYPDKMILLFGSYAKFMAKEDSDIDIYVDTEERSVKDGMKKLFEKLSIKIGKFDKDDLLIKEIIKNHIILLGVERYYEKIGFLRET